MRNNRHMFTHKCTTQKVEVAFFLAIDKSRLNNNKLVTNINNLDDADISSRNTLLHKYPFISAVYQKKSSSKQTEGLKKIKQIEGKGYLVRTYKLVGTPWMKIEITLPVYKTREYSIKLGVKIGTKLQKGLQKSIKPYYMQNGSEFSPIFRQ